MDDRLVGQARRQRFVVQDLAPVVGAQGENGPQRVAAAGRFEQHADKTAKALRVGRRGDREVAGVVDRCPAPSSKTSIALLHAALWLSLISPRYSTCR